MKALIKKIGLAEITHGRTNISGWEFDSARPHNPAPGGHVHTNIAGWTVPELVAVSAVCTNCGEDEAYDMARQLARGAKD